MKKNILAIVAIFLFTYCGNDAKEESEQTEANTEVVLDKVEELKVLNDALINANIHSIGEAAKTLFDKANEFANTYPAHEKTPQALELAAKAAEAMGQFDVAVNILHKLINEFPETNDTPSYMWNKARIIEEKMEKIPNAKAAYTELIERFPDEQIAIDAKAYVDNFLGKTQEEILQMLDSINAPIP